MATPARATDPDWRRCPCPPHDGNISSCVRAAERKTWSASRFSVSEARPGTPLHNLADNHKGVLHLFGWALRVYETNAIIEQADVSQRWRGKAAAAHLRGDAQPSTGPYEPDLTLGAALRFLFPELAEQDQRLSNPHSPANPGVPDWCLDRRTARETNPGLPNQRSLPQNPKPPRLLEFHIPPAAEPAPPATTGRIGCV